MSLPAPVSRAMRVYPLGDKFVIGCKDTTEPIWWYGGGIASASLCRPKRLTLLQAKKALPEARALLRRAREATY